MKDLDINETVDVLNTLSVKEEKKEEKKWIEVIPHGLVGGMIPNLCLMIFKEKEGSQRFAISLSHLQGQISVNQSMNKEEPLKFISELLSLMKVKLEACYFLKSSNGHVIARVFIKGHPNISSMNVKANDIIPLAVYSGCRFYCTELFMEQMLDQKIEKPLKKGFVRKPLYIN